MKYGRGCPVPRRLYFAPVLRLRAVVSNVVSSTEFSIATAVVDTFELMM